MTLNPSAAATLAACTPAQARIHSSTKGTECPAASEIGTVDLEVPTLPEAPAVPTSPLKGKIYLGGPESGPITGPPYIVYLDAESERYGVSVRIKGETIPNEATGRVTTVFSENPEQPFTKATLHFKGGDLAPIANPLACGAATATARSSRFTGSGAFSPALTPFVVDSNGTGGACAKPIAVLAGAGDGEQQPATRADTPTTRSTSNAPSGQQYLSEVKTTLPAGLVGTIPAAKQCAEADSQRRHVLRGKPDRLGQRDRRRRAQAVHVPRRARLPDRPLPRRPVRPVDRRPGGRRAVQPRQRGDAGEDRHRSDDRARDGQQRAAARAQGSGPAPA